jgi:cytochrome c
MAEAKRGLEKCAGKAGGATPWALSEPCAAGFALARRTPHSGAQRQTKGSHMKHLVAAAALALLAAAPAAAQDVAAGEKSFAKCRACHQVGETAKNVVGPQLNGLFGRTAGTVEGYNYSEANKKSGIVWDEAVFKEYIRKPAAKIPGTKMAFAGIANDKEIDDLTAYLKQFGKDGKKQ